MNSLLPSEGFVAAVIWSRTRFRPTFFLPISPGRAEGYRSRRPLPRSAVAAAGWIRLPREGRRVGGGADADRRSHRRWRLPGPQRGDPGGGPEGGGRLSATTRRVQRWVW